LLLILISNLALLINFRTVKATTITVTKTFTSSAYDGYLKDSGPMYLYVWNDSTGTVRDGDDTIIIGQEIIWAIYRAFLFFDTSTIPSSATIINATLSLNINYATPPQTNFTVVIQKNKDTYPEYPHTPLVPEDYNKEYYYGDGGNRSTTTISGNGWWNITYNPTGLSWINKGGITKVVLRSNQEINGQPPTNLTAITFYSNEKGQDYAPKLYVTYQTEGCKYVFYGPISEGTGLQCGNINVTVYPLTATPFTFNLSGSYTLQLEEQPRSFTWALGSNYTRTYTPISNYEEIYIFIPDSPYFTYTIEIIDFVGLHNVYVESMVSANGSLRVAERKQIPTGGKVSMCLTEFKTYSYTLKANEGTIFLGARETPQRPIWDEVKITFVVTSAMIPVAPTNYEGVSLAVQRVNGTLIQVYYSDERNNTQTVNVTITYKTNVEYMQTFTSQPVLVNWNDALPQYDYLVTVEAMHNDYGTIRWQLPCPATQSPSHVSFNWDTVFGWIGDWPITPSNMISMMVILAAIVLGSFRDASFALFLGLIVAGVLISLGWYSMSWSSLTIILCLIIIFAIIKGKREWFER